MLKQYLIDNYTHNELADVAIHGCSGGFGDFIYYCDTVRHFEQFKDDCFDIINAYNEMTGEKGFPQYIQDNMSDYAHFANAMIWFSVEWIADDITAGEYLEEIA